MKINGNSNRLIRNNMTSKKNSTSSTETPPTTKNLLSPFSEYIILNLVRVKNSSRLSIKGWVVLSQSKRNLGCRIGNISTRFIRRFRRRNHPKLLTLLTVCPKIFGRKLFRDKSPEIHALRQVAFLSEESKWSKKVTRGNVRFWILRGVWPPANLREINQKLVDRRIGVLRHLLMSIAPPNTKNVQY